MKVLVLGGYGLIGSAVVARLVAGGHQVAGLGRDVGKARRAMPAVRWVADDMATLVEPGRWLPLLAGFDAVVNAAGALQDGARDDLDAVHHRSVAALAAACHIAGVRRFVQISAVGADPASPDAFFRTKAAGDAAIAGSGVEWTILRPGLVIAPAAYGGTALLRALAGFPGLVPAVLADRPIQTVCVQDVAEAVSRALDGGLPTGLVLDLVEDEVRPLSGVLSAFRAWLGLPPARIVPMPAALGRAAGAVADGLGRLGWRSPLRSAALTALERGVTGDPLPWRSATGTSLRPLQATLAAMPATVHERWFARLWLLKPLILGCLSVFWIASGAIALARIGEAADVLTARGFDDGLARLAVVAGAIADIAVGAAVLVRRWARTALLGMVAIGAAYLAAATAVAPDLWLDPLGPLVKVVPGLCLVLVALAILDER